MRGDAAPQRGGALQVRPQPRVLRAVPALREAGRPPDADSAAQAGRHAAAGRTGKKMFFTVKEWKENVSFSERHDRHHRVLPADPDGVRLLLAGGRA